MDQPDQTGVGFARMVDAVIRTSNIKNITILKADTLQRYNIMTAKGLTEEKAIEETKKISPDWEWENKRALERLKSHLKNHGGTFTNKSWDDYRLSESGEKNPEFTALHEKIKKDFEVNAKEKDQTRKKYTQGFRKQVNNFARNLYATLNEKAKKKNNTISKQAFSNIKSYILEECAMRIVFAKSSSDEPFDYELYKTDLSRAMLCSSEHYLRDEPHKMKHIHFVSPNKKVIDTFPNLSISGNRNHVAFFPTEEIHAAYSKQPPINPIVMAAFHQAMYVVNKEVTAGKSDGSEYVFISELWKLVGDFVKAKKSSDGNKFPNHSPENYINTYDDAVPRADSSDSTQKFGMSK